MPATALPLFVVDAFTARPFAGNPAAVCLLDGPRRVEQADGGRVAGEGAGGEGIDDEQRPRHDHLLKSRLDRGRF